MIPSTACIRFAADGSAQVETALRLTASSHIRCCTYPDRPAIVSAGDGHVSVSFTVPDPAQVSVDDLEAAVRLAEALADYIADLRRWMTAQDGPPMRPDTAGRPAASTCGPSLVLTPTHLP